MQNLQNVFSLAAISLVACNDYDCPQGEERRGSSCGEVQVDDASASVEEGDGSSDARVAEKPERDAGARKDADTRDADSNGEDGSNREDGSGETTIEGERDGGSDTKPSTQAAPEDAGRGPAPVEAGSAPPPEAGRDAGAVMSTPDASMAAPMAPSCVPSTEVCDGKDNDCDGMIDEDAQTWYCDADGDGFAASTLGSQEACNKPAASNSCKGWTTKLPSGVDAQDCDDASALRYPGAGFGLSPSSSGDLNCDGKTETKIELVDTDTPSRYSNTTRLNICEHTLEEAERIGECDCWFSSVIIKGFIGLDSSKLLIVDDSPGAGSIPYFMPTFPCAQALTDAIFLLRRSTLASQCAMDEGFVIARQLCR